ncbi:MAG: hypothetical protein AAF192_08680 [Pseudomonadota bacterium]
MAMTTIIETTEPHVARAIVTGDLCPAKILSWLGLEGDDAREDALDRVAGAMAAGRVSPDDVTDAAASALALARGLIGLAENPPEADAAAGER